jgi:hypothetical protein
MQTSGFEFITWVNLLSSKKIKFADQFVRISEDKDCSYICETDSFENRLMFFKKHLDTLVSSHNHFFKKTRKCDSHWFGPEFGRFYK